MQSQQALLPLTARSFGWGALACAALMIWAPAPARAGTLLAPSASQEDNYNEQFTFTADLADGGYVWIQLAVSNLGPGAGHGACRVIALRPGQKPWTAMERVSRDKWSHDAASDTLKVATCSATLGESLIVRANLDGGSAELRLTGRAAATIPHRAVTVGAGNHETTLLYAFAAATATVQFPGQAAVPSAGGGNAEHTRSTVEPRSLAKRWVRFRALRGPSKLLLLARQDQAGRLEPGWTMAPGNSVVRLDRLQLLKGGTKNGPEWTFDFRAGGRVLQLKSVSLLHRSAPIEEMSAFIAAVLRPIVGSPVTFIHRASLQVDGGPVIAGILEVSEHD